MVKSILIVDDSAFDRKIVNVLLKKAGFEVREADGGINALGVLRDSEIRFDLIVTDLNMPLMDGLLFTENVRNSVFYRNVPIIMFSGDTTPENIKKAKSLKLSAWLKKSNADMLVETVQRLLF